MGLALSAEGLALISECAAAGVVFHPGDGRLNAELTRGQPPPELLARVKEHRAELVAWFGELFAWMDEPAEDVDA